MHHLHRKDSLVVIINQYPKGDRGLLPLTKYMASAKV